MKLAAVIATLALSFLPSALADVRAVPKSREPGKPLSTKEAWERLSSVPPMLLPTGYTLAFEQAKTANEILASSAEGAALFTAMLNAGDAPDSFVYVHLSTAPVDVIPPGFTATENPHLLEEMTVQLLSGANPGSPGIRAVELWLGCAEDSNPADKVSTCVTLLVGVNLDGSRSLILGVIGQANDEHYVGSLSTYCGDWMFEAYGEPSRKEVSQGSGGWLSTTAAAPIPGKKQLKLSGKSFSKCFASCMLISSPGITKAQITCIAAAALLCIPAGPGYAACLLPAAAFCGVTGRILQILFCAIRCA